MTELTCFILADKVISIHMPHTWHDHDYAPAEREAKISIHMPHTWHDSPTVSPAQAKKDFNPHATYVA